MKIILTENNVARSSPAQYWSSLCSPFISITTLPHLFYQKSAMRCCRIFKEKFGNPSSDHFYGRNTREAINEARYEVAETLGSSPDEIFFTSCATEANNLAILGLAQTLAPGKRHVITSVIEHPSVMQPFLRLQAIGWKINFIPVDKNGRVNVENLKSAIRPDTAFVSIMHANNDRYCLGGRKDFRSDSINCLARSVPDFVCERDQLVQTNQKSCPMAPKL